MNFRRVLYIKPVKTCVLFLQFTTARVSDRPAVTFKFMYNVMYVFCDINQDRFMFTHRSKGFTHIFNGREL